MAKKINSTLMLMGFVWYLFSTVFVYFCLIFVKDCKTQGEKIHCACTKCVIFDTTAESNITEVRYVIITHIAQNLCQLRAERATKRILRAIAHIHPKCQSGAPQSAPCVLC